MLRYHLWHILLNKVYSLEWWVNRAVQSTEAKFFKAEIDYNEKYETWNESLEHLENYNDLDYDDLLEDDDEQ